MAHTYLFFAEDLEGPRAAETISILREALVEDPYSKANHSGRYYLRVAVCDVRDEDERAAAEDVAEEDYIAALRARGWR